MYKGQLEGFPKEVVDKMLERQFEQKGVLNITVLESNRFGGFRWKDTIEGLEFWEAVVDEKNFDKFYERYPKQNTMDKKTLMQQLLAADPSKEAELKKIYPEVFGYDLMSISRKEEGSGWEVFGNSSEESPCIGIMTVEGEQCFYLDTNHIWEIKDNYYLYAKPEP